MPRLTSTLTQFWQINSHTTLPQRSTRSSHDVTADTYKIMLWIINDQIQLNITCKSPSLEYIMDYSHTDMLRQIIFAFCMTHQQWCDSYFGNQDICLLSNKVNIMATQGPVIQRAKPSADNIVFHGIRVIVMWAMKHLKQADQLNVFHTYALAWWMQTARNPSKNIHQLRNYSFSKKLGVWWECQEGPKVWMTMLLHIHRQRQIHRTWDGAVMEL